MIDFDIAKTLLQEFTLHVEYFVHGIEESKLDPDTVLDDKTCNLGEWLQGSGRRYSSLPEYGDLIREHRRYHQVAGRLIAEYLADDQTTQRLDLTSLHASTKVVIDAIDRLQSSVRSSQTTLAGSSLDARYEKAFNASSWRATIPVESKLIDEQHRVMLRLIERLNSEPDVPVSSESFCNLKLALDQILTLHFETEERLMDAVQYPIQARQEHVSEHRRLLGLSLELNSDSMQNPGKAASGVYRVIKREVLNHIDQYDMNLTSYLVGVS